MADLKITDLPALAVAVGADLLAIVDDVPGTPITSKITLTNLNTFLSGSFVDLSTAQTAAGSKTWSDSATAAAQWDFTLSRSGITGPINLESDNPFLLWSETGLAADSGRWLFGSANGNFFLRGQTDAGANIAVMQFNRTAGVVDNVQFDVNIDAATVAADFDAVTATSYGGILEANLLDKTSTETITGAYIFQNASGIVITDSGGTDSLAISHDGVDANFVFTNTTDLNITGITSIQAGTIDADFDALSATSLILTTPLDETDGGTGQSTYATGDILFASAVNTLSKLTAGANTEVLTLAAGVPSWAVPSTGNVSNTGTPLDNQIAVWTDATTIEGDAGFTWNGTTLSATQFGGILEANLLDKSAVETVSGAYTFSTGTAFTNGATFTVGNIVAGTINADFAAITGTSYGGILEANLLDKSATETVSGAYTYTGGVTFTTGNIVAGTIDADFDAITGTSFGGITEANLVDKSAVETVSAQWDFTFARSGVTGPINLSSTNPFLLWEETDAAVDEGRWLFGSAAGNFLFRGMTDAGANIEIMRFNRTAGVIDDIRFDVALDINATASFSDTIFITERAAADTDVTADGQFWVRNDDPNLPIFTDGDGDVDQVLDPSLSEINTQNANYTLVIGDKGKTIYKASGGAGETITIPANASVAFVIGTLIAFDNDGGGDLSIAITTDTLVGTDGITGTRTLGDNDNAAIRKLTATRWRYMASDL